jgi:hypothetical protein
LKVNNDDNASQALNRNFAQEFHEFLGRLPSSESLDDPLVLPHNAEIRKADFLFFERAVIAEVKQLEEDPAYKADAIIDKYRDHESFPLFFGQRTLDQILAHMPEDLRERIRNEVFESVTRVITGYCEDANRQIRETREYFSLDSAGGVLFILNDSIQIISPDVLGARIQQQLHKRKPDGTDRFPDIAYAVAYSWAHFVVDASGGVVHPILVVEGPGAPRALAAKGHIDYIVHAWNEYSGAWLRSDGKATREQLERHIPALNEPPAEKISRQEAWRRNYLKSRYLKKLSKDALFAHGRAVFAKLSPHFLKGTTREGDLMELMEEWTHFMEECQIRNLDLRGFKPMDAS